MLSVCIISEHAPLHKNILSEQVISVNHSIKEDRALLQGFQKLVAITLALVMSVVYVVAGFYGSVGVLKGFLIIAQLFGSSLVVIYFDELLQKGYGLGSGIALFTCAAVSLDVFWKVCEEHVCDNMDDELYDGVILVLL